MSENLSKNSAYYYRKALILAVIGTLWVIVCALDGGLNSVIPAIGGAIVGFFYYEFSMQAALRHRAELEAEKIRQLADLETLRTADTRAPQNGGGE